MVDTFVFSDIEIDDLLNNRAYEIAELLEKIYNDLDDEVKNVGDFSE